MLVQIVRGKLKPGKWQEFEDAYRKAIIDAGPIEGLCGRWLVQDVDDPDSGSTISLWATIEQLKAYEKSDVLKGKISARLAPFFSGEYDVRISNVRFAEGEPSPNQWLSEPTDWGAD